MAVKIGLAKSADELEQVYRFRYRVYVEEMRRPQTYADHVAKRIEEPLDKSGHVLMACDIDGVVGTSRYNVGVDANFGIYEDLYSLRAFDQFYPSHVSITTKLMVAQAYRRSTLPLQLAVQCYKAGVELGTYYDIIDCNHPLVGFFTRLGYRQIFPDIDHPEYGHVVPMVLVMYDFEHLTACGSPFSKLAAGHNDRGSVEYFNEIIVPRARDEQGSKHARTT